MKKILVIGICALLLTLVFSNIAVAEEEKLIDVEVTDYKADGSTEQRIVRLSLDEVKEFRAEILNADGFEERNQIFKDYKLIPENTNLEDLKQGMFEKAEQMGITPDVDAKKLGLRLPVMVSFFDKVDVMCFGGMSLRLGTTPIVNLIKKIIRIKLPGIDLVDVCGGLFCFVNAKGLLIEDTLVSFFGVAGVAGFVGTTVKIPLMMHIFSGYSAMTFGAGMGVRLRTYRFIPNPDPDPDPEV